MSYRAFPKLEDGRTYRLRRNFEVREEETGTLRAYFRKGELLVLKRVVPEESRVYVEGTEWPLPLDALAKAVDPV